MSGKLEKEVDIFLDDLIAGMRQSQKQISCKYFYDRRGCELFEQICELDEYYLTRTELEIMKSRGQEMADLIGPRGTLVELGSGAGIKTRILLDHLDHPNAYVPVDVASDHLQETRERLAEDYPALPIFPVCADFTQEFEIPEIDVATNRITVYFPGSTIGNLEERQATQLLQRKRKICGTNGGMLIGIDLQKDVEVILAAYNDAKGVTAEFNKNLLHRANRELGTNFEIDRFRHDARYDQSTGRIEMHLECLSDQTVRIGDSQFNLHRGETILTEFSHKYKLDQFSAMAKRAGFQLRQTWTDQRKYFAVVYLAAE